MWVMGTKARCSERKKKKKQLLLTAKQSFQYHDVVSIGNVGGRKHAKLIPGGVIL